MNQSAQSRIPVVFICDENYAMPAAVAITTLKASRKQDTLYDVFVLGVGISQDSRERISSLSSDSFRVTVLERELSADQQRVIQLRERVTTAALLKFDLPLIFRDYDKLLYLDCDMAIQKDLSPLFEIDVSDVYAAVVKDTITMHGSHEHLEFLEYKQDIYFNSGMMLLNLERLRADGMPEKLLDYRLNGKNGFMDQDALNVVFAGKIKCVSPYFNLLTCFFDWDSVEELSAFYGVEFPRSKILAYQNAYILHFGDKEKPWLCEAGYLSTLYIEYHKLSPYADRPLDVEGQALRRDLIDAREEISVLERKVDEYAHSLSFRVGHVITWLPRALWRAVRRLRKAETS